MTTSLNLKMGGGEQEKRTLNQDFVLKVDRDVLGNTIMNLNALTTA